MTGVSAAAPTTWRPQLGAWPESGAVTFRVWAPARTRVDLVLDPGRPTSRPRPLAAAADGYFVGRYDDVAAGDLYGYLLDGEGPFPDPASRYQPHGVHGPSAVVDPRTFRWSDETWRGVALADAVVYELHIGTFSAPGTFAAAIERLPHLAHLGVTVLELMPVADFPGRRNWGYDGVSLFAPSRAYGAPDDLRRLVDTAHQNGLAVILDVVYNHFGPDGAYGSLFSPSYVSDRHRSPWGAAVNLDGSASREVRAFFIENAQHWIHEYHLDGLRFDATHGLVDGSPQHLLGELAAEVRASIAHRRVLLMAEDDRNLAAIVRPVEEGGWGFDAVWADDFHHQVRRLVAGDRDGYFQDFTGTTRDLATTISRGWFYSGQVSAYRQESRGTDPTGIPLCRMVVCLQNHDQIGNRAFGERLNHQIGLAVFRAVSALLLFLPETPLLFMGQEWAATSPFLFFTDHRPDLGHLVRDGRREEFARFDAFADPAVRMRIPDPQADSTYEDSRLRWDERFQPPHAGVCELYRQLLTLRRTELARRPAAQGVSAVAPDEASIVVRRGSGADALLLVLSTRASSRVQLGNTADLPSGRRWEILLSTEDARFRESLDPARTPGVELTPEQRGLAVTFARPAAVVLHPV